MAAFPALLLNPLLRALEDPEMMTLGGARRRCGGVLCFGWEWLCGTSGLCNYHATGSSRSGMREHWSAAMQSVGAEQGRVLWGCWMQPHRSSCVDWLDV